MGALHDGHLSLIQRSLDENDLTLVSSFVNPTQFDDPNDLVRYPRNWQADLDFLERAGAPRSGHVATGRLRSGSESRARRGADFLLRPEADELYRDQFHYRISENDLSTKLCGAHRPGHFDGVLTVVMKLLNIARADRAYFGEKDYQQFLLVRGMAESFFHATRIIACPTVREPDGLALSSRNRLLNDADRRLAASFPRLLSGAGTPESIAAELRAVGFDVDYVEDRFGRRFGAVRLGGVRLIDNFPLSAAESREHEPRRPVQGNDPV